jgi:hypothetical protein
MSAETVILKYMGAALPGNGAVVSIFDSTIAFPSAQYIAMNRLKRLVTDIKNDQAGTLTWYKSQTRVSSPSATPVWVAIGTLAVAIAAANTTNFNEFLIEEYADFKLEWTNGATPQTQFVVDVALTGERVKAT